MVATGVLRDELFAHLSPGRDTDRYFLMPEGDKLQLLERASVRKLTPEETYREQQRRAARGASGGAADRLMELIQKGKGRRRRVQSSWANGRRSAFAAGECVYSRASAGRSQCAPAAVRRLVAGPG